MLGRVLVVYVFAAVSHPPLVAMDAEHDGAVGRWRRWRARTRTGIVTITVKQLIRLTNFHQNLFHKVRSLSISLSFCSKQDDDHISQFHQIKVLKYLLIRVMQGVRSKSLNPLSANPTLTRPFLQQCVHLLASVISGSRCTVVLQPQMLLKSISTSLPCVNTLSAINWHPCQIYWHQISMKLSDVRF